MYQELYSTVNVLVRNKSCLLFYNAKETLCLRDKCLKSWSWNWIVTDA